MVIDSSALLAILLLEPDHDILARTIDAESPRLISAASHVELSVVLLRRFGEDALPTLDTYVAEAKLEIVSVDVDQARIARQAFRDYGKGRHPASLDFGDCFSYALAKSRGEPLLCKGDDFSKTDLDLYPLPEITIHRMAP